MPPRELVAVRIGAVSHDAAGGQCCLGTCRCAAGPFAFTEYEPAKSSKTAFYTTKPPDKRGNISGLPAIQNKNGGGLSGTIWAIRKP
jgi:hypothetical protein